MEIFNITKDSYLLHLSQEELDFLEVLLANTCGADGWANRMTSKFQAHSTPRNLYSVVIDQTEWRITNGRTLLFKRAKPPIYLPSTV